ncbi:MAG: hypothetical protein K8R23_06625 [Chthoniobacter sp.]|nr:hypothetical protein [Chthoniobacter sp.]
MRHFIRCLLPFLVVARMGWADEPSAEGVKLAGEVLEIFTAKCLDCHAADLPKPKGKFGYVLDLKRVAANPDYVTTGHPEKSDLYVMIRDGDMPGEDAKVPPMTKAEKETVRRWIELGAPEPAPGTVARIGVVAKVPELAELPPPMPAWKRALRWVGRFHPVSTHFPVALMLTAVLAEGLAWWTKRESWSQTVRFLVVIAALGAAATSVLGWINAYFTSYAGQNAVILSWHRWLGTGTSAWALLCAGLAMIGDNREGTPERQRLRGALLAGAGLVSITGFLGSALIYGLDHYALW